MNERALNRRRASTPEVAVRSRGQRRRRFGASGVLAAMAFVALPAPAGAQEAAVETVAIVTHPDAPVSDLTFEQLRSIFLGEQQFWPDRSRITILMRAPVAPERDVVLRRVYQMDEDRYRQYWIAKMFRAEVPSGPKAVFSSDMTRDLVTVIPGAIAFMPESAVTPDLKVLRIDGRLPSDEGYPLRPRG
jgi:hypothetical protein